MVQVITTFGTAWFAIKFGHVIFFVPLISIQILYSTIFLKHKIIPGQDNFKNRDRLFALVLFLTFCTFIYRLLFTSQVFFEVPKNICKINPFYLDKKMCVALMVGTTGNLYVMILKTFIALYFTYMHWIYAYFENFKVDYYSMQEAYAQREDEIDAVKITTPVKKISSGKLKD